MTTHVDYTNLVTKHFSTQLIIPELAKELGLDETIVLQQVHYWLQRCGKVIDNVIWIYNSFNEWTEQFSYWSISKVKRVFYSLEKEGLLISRKINKSKKDHTKWYSINYKKLTSFVNISCKKMARQKKNLSRSKMNVRSSQFETIYNRTENNYTNTSSYIEKKQINKPENLEEKIKNKFSKSSFGTSIPKYQELIEPTSHTEVEITQKEQEIAKEMVAVWNEEFKYSLKPIKAFSNKKTAKMLYNLHQTKFNSNLDEWKNYALKVNSSKFLMGEKDSKTGFKAVFQWLTKQEIVEAIQGGAYGVGDRELDRNNLTQNIEKQKEEIVKQTGGKIAQYLKNNVSEEKEKAEFNAYVLGKKFEKDGDIYRIKHLVTNNTWLSPQGLIYDSRHKGMYQTLYESFVMKKYLGKTNLEARAEMKRNIDSLSQKSMGVELFERLSSIKNKVESVIFNSCGISYLLDTIEIS